MTSLGRSKKTLGTVWTADKTLKQTRLFSFETRLRTLKPSNKPVYARFEQKAVRIKEF